MLHSVTRALATIGEGVVVVCVGVKLNLCYIRWSRKDSLPFPVNQVIWYYKIAIIEEEHRRITDV